MSRNIMKLKESIEFKFDDKNEEVQIRPSTGFWISKMFI